MATQNLGRVFGWKGWTQKFVNENYGDKRLKKLVDYIDGEGTKPTDNINEYLTTDGSFTTNKDLAADFRGAQGDKGDTGAQGEAGDIQNLFKTLAIGAGGLVTLKPTPSYSSYKLNVNANMILNIDLSKMLSQVGGARFRLIIDMPIVRTITITNPILWGGTIPTFATAGQYVFEVVDVDGGNTPLIWQVASTTKVEPTGNILYVDSTGADYSEGQINAGTPTRTTSSWATPFKYLQNAINAATAGDIIFVKAGTYKPTHLRTTPTVYVDGDRLNRNATFTPKNSVDIYGGFAGTETKTWQRAIDANGYMVNKTILSGDIASEAVIDGGITIGDKRTTLSKANASYNVVFAKAITALTYFNGFDVTYGYANGSGSQENGAGVYSGGLFISINCTATNNTAVYTGGGWIYGTNTNCTSTNNTSQFGGGWFEGTSTNCTAINNTSQYGGGWNGGTNTNCSANNNTATNYGGGWIYGTNTNCTATNNASSFGSGWFEGTNTNCIASNNIVINSGGGWYGGTNTNCVASNNTAANGGGWIIGANTNCTATNNVGAEAVYGASDTDKHINCLIFNNKTAGGVAVGFNDVSASGVKIFRNNAYDVAHPTITGGGGSDINFATCIQNLTALQTKIEVPSFVGATTDPTQKTELDTYLANILTNLKPKAGSVLKGAGINDVTYHNPTDFNNVTRPTASTIGILEGV